MPHSILIVAPEAAAHPIAEVLSRDIPTEVITASDRRSAISALRRHDFELILIDEALTSADPAAADLIAQNTGAALVVDVNFAISSASRVLRLTRASLARQAQDRAHARAAASAAIYSELNAALSGILLEAELALRESAPEQQPRLRHLLQLSTDLRDRLRPRS